MQTTLLFVLVLLTLALSYSIYRRRSNPLESPNSGEIRYRYWGIKLEPPPSGACCKAMLALKGSNFPKHKAPPLPLPGCPLLRCQCLHGALPEQRNDEERREEEDRRQEMRFGTNTERRSFWDRRDIDNPWEGDR